jgi:hypothetical protein
MEDFKNRLLAFIESHCKMSVRAFEESCGLTNGTVGSVKKKGPGADIVQKIFYTFPELNLNWLFSGVGPMLTTKESRQTTEHVLPLIPMEAFAGPGLPAYEDERVEDFYTVSEFKNSDFLIRVKGDSMVPKYNGGDIVACKKVELNNLYFLQWNRAYVIGTRSQGIMIKRVHPSEKEGYIKCVSDNAKYPPFDVPVDDIVQIALVNGAITLE